MKPTYEPRKDYKHYPLVQPKKERNAMPVALAKSDSAAATNVSAPTLFVISSRAMPLCHCRATALHMLHAAG